MQLAKAHGATVYSTASGDGVDLVRDLGGDKAIDYRHQDFEKEVPPVDLVLDLVGGEVQKRSWNVLKPGGTLISTLDEPDKQMCEAKQAKAMRFLVEPDGEQLARIGQLMDEGKVQVLVSETFELEHAAEAHRMLEESHPKGKIVFVI